MASANDYQRHAERVRKYLSNLDDAPDAQHDQSIIAVAIRHHVQPTKLRQFRDGTDLALAKGMVVTWSRLLGADATVLRGDPGDLDGEAWGSGEQRERLREDRYEHYHTIETSRPEAEQALNVWADMVCTGSVGEDTRYSGGFEPQLVHPNEQLRAMLSNIAYRVNQYVIPDSQKMLVVRDMAKFGDWFEQVGLARDRTGVHVTRLEPMDLCRMRVISSDPAKMYGYFPRGATEPTSTFPAWKCIHFANRRSRADIYGASIYQSDTRSWVQVEAMEGGMITRRLERAPMRYKWTIDTAGTAGPDDRFKEVKRWKEEYKKQRTVDGSQNYQKQKITPPAGEDLFIGKSSQDSPADVEVLQGDANLNDIADFAHFWNKWLSGLGPPKHHLGYEADTMRSVGTELTIVFARKARRMQVNFIHGLNHIYWLELILAGIDPREIPYTIYPPSLGTRDELVRAQVQMAHATSVRYLAAAFSSTGEMPSIGWFLRHIMGLDDEAIHQADMVPVVQAGGGQSGGKSDGGDKGTDPQPGDPALAPTEVVNMRKHLAKDKEVAAELKYAKFLIDERRIANLPPDEYIRASGIGLADIFPARFDVEETAKQFGLKELWKP